MAVVVTPEWHAPLENDFPGNTTSRRHRVRGPGALQRAAIVIAIVIVIVVYWYYYVFFKERTLPDDM